MAEAAGCGGMVVAVEPPIVGGTAAPEAEAEEELGAIGAACTAEPFVTGGRRDAGRRRRRIGARRHHAQQLVHLDLVRVREIVPCGNVAIVLPVVERDPVERVSRLHAVVARRGWPERYS